MTLRDEILARGDLAASVAARDIGAIAVAISAGRTSVQPRMVTARAIISECANGGAILDSLDQAASVNTNVKWAMKFLAQDAGIDIGNVATRMLIDGLVTAGALTQVQGDALKHLAVQPAPVTPFEVATALYNDDGTTK
jgi:hypothetical protein